jgi:fructokinase
MSVISSVRTSKPLYAGIEAGGTKFVCAVGSGPDDLRALTQFPTTTSDETLAQVIAFLRAQQAITPIAAVGIGSFGPVDLNASSPTYGHITSTPKPGWADADIVGIIKRHINVPVALDTDVNAAALGEHTWGAAQGLDIFAYLTVGTGIGGGVLANGKLLHGILHPEVGHMLLPHDMQSNPFPGTCPYHRDCLEGLASGPALEQRWGQRGETLPPDHPAWPLEAHYLALALTNLIYVLSPQRIVLGGGVMKQSRLLPMVRKEVQTLLNGYIQLPQLLTDIERYIVLPALGDRAGVLGAIALAQRLAT